MGIPPSRTACRYLAAAISRSYVRATARSDSICASNVGTTDVRTAADAVHPSSFGDVALDDGTPAADFHEALGRAVLVREVALLVIARAVAPLVNGSTEEPEGAQVLVERDDRRSADTADRAAF